MSIHTKRNFYLALIATFIAIIGLSMYYLLGGFQEVHVYQMEPVQRTVVGKFFTDPSSSEAADHRKMCRELVENRAIDGLLTEVIYLLDSASEEEEGRFFGISLEQDVVEIPRDFEVREYESGIRFGVFLSMHFLVQPGGAKIEKMLYDKAGTEGYALRNYFFNLNYEDGSRSVEGWVK